MLRRYPETLRWRQALPPLFVLSLFGLALLSTFIPLMRLLLAGEILVYFLVMFLAGLWAAYRQGRLYLAVGLPLAISIMHIAWGGGFLWSILGLGIRKNG
jgi:uncharacterized membrane protein